MSQLIMAKTLANGDTVQVLKYEGDWFPLTHCLRLFRTFYARPEDREHTQYLVEVQQFFSEREALEEFEKR